MKKFAAIVIVLALVCTFGFSAFAAPITALPDSNTEIPVTGSYDADSIDAVYSVEITWGAMTWTYDISAAEWNVTNHEYDEADDGAWVPTATGTSDVITITNGSNAPVKADFAFGAESAFTGVTMTAIPTVNVAACDDSLSACPTATAKVILDDSVTDRASFAASSTVGTVTVTIAANGAVVGPTAP